MLNEGKRPLKSVKRKCFIARDIYSHSQSEYDLSRDWPLPERYVDWFANTNRLE